MFHHLKAITLRWNIIWSCREIMVLFFAKCGGPGISDSGPRLLLLLWMKNWISNWNVQEMYKTNAKRKNKKALKSRSHYGPGLLLLPEFGLGWTANPICLTIVHDASEITHLMSSKKMGIILIAAISLPPSWFYYIYLYSYILLYLPQIGDGVSL